MKTLFSMLVLTFLISLSPSGVFGADKIIIAADTWMPYNGLPDSDSPGYVIEAARKIFTKKGYDFDYMVLPYARAVYEAKNGSISGVVGALKEELPDFIFPDSEQGVSSNNFYVKPGKKWKYSGIDSLKNVVIGAIKNYKYGNDELDNYLAGENEKVYIASGEDALEKLIKMLDAGRIDVLIEDDQVVNYRLLKLKMSGKIEFAGSTGIKNNIYIAFNPKNPGSKKYAETLSAGMTELRKTGELKSILQKYGISDWRK